MPTSCEVPGCERVRRARNMCKGHYERVRKGLPLDPPLRRYDPGSLCTVEDCERTYYGEGFCSLHYDRTRAQIRLDKPLRNGRIRERKGYILRRCPEHPSAKGGYVLEHRLVMEQTLGRLLLENENVHHKNGVRDDNRPENLELWVTSQPSGQRTEDLVAWAREILARYAA